MTVILPCLRYVSQVHEELSKLYPWRAWIYIVCMLHSATVCASLSLLQLLQNTDLFDTGGDDSDSEGECSKLGPPSLLPVSPPPPTTQRKRKKGGAREPRREKEKKVSVWIDIVP